MPRIAANQAVNFIKGLPARMGPTMQGLWASAPRWMQKMGAGWREDALIVGRAAKKVGRAASWPYRGSFERGAVFTAGVGLGVGGYYGIRALKRRFGGVDRNAMYRRAQYMGPKTRATTNYIQRNFG